MPEGPKSARLLPIAATILGLAALIVATGWLSGPAVTIDSVRLWLSNVVDGTDAPSRGGFEDIVDRVKPAVFGVSTKVLEEEEENAIILQEFLQEFGEPDASEDKPEGFGKREEELQEPKRPRLIKNEGSGFFISPDGYAVTANHVIERGRSIEITTSEGKRYPVRIIGADPETDIALIKVDGSNRFPFVEVADRPPRIGEWVIAVGNPFGLGGTVTAGIVSAGARDLMPKGYSDYIQIDAPVNQGNSGGPTFDIDGKVIGVNSAIFSPTGGSIGIGFAIPAETVRAVVPQLKQRGMVTRGWMGVHIQDVTPELADSLGLKQARGALVAEANAGSPAAKAGILSGDVITALNGSPVRGDRELVKAVSETPPGTVVELGLIRKENGMTVSLKVEQHPGSGDGTPAEEQWHEQPDPGPAMSQLGLTLAPGKDIGPNTSGVVVTDVEPGGVAAERGLEPGDIILEVGGQAVNVPSDVDRALSNARAGSRHNVLARVKSGDSTHFVAMPVG
ncbi:MAG: trypsin-like peptidase domain-containing protein [Methyloceanibacter sp.]|uniref:trypsin-like peptidase domain-containing protein n=1 Tax=Methyloceanibacter sp. TaxID=1965321 RepID=UPI003D6C8D0A